MTDAHLPGEWLTDPRMDGLSDRAWRTFTGSLMWSNEQGTDGAVQKRALRYLHPDGVNDATLVELVTAGLWAESPDGVTVLNWAKLGQSMAEQVEWQKERNRRKQAEYRRKHPMVTGAVTGAVTGRITGYVGQDSDRTATGKDSDSEVPVLVWDVAEIPGSDQALAEQYALEGEVAF